MKVVTNISRIIVGILFIISGLVKANDPTGLGIKMTEFFNIWGTTGLNSYAFTLSILMILFEVLAGIAILIGWRIKLFSALTLLLIIFFTFLTGYANFTGTPATCGCFGDCIPLTAKQSFTKDLILLALVLLVFTYSHYIHPIFKQIVSASIIAIFTTITGVFMWYVKHHNPVKDCLAFKVGTNIKKVKYGDVDDQKLKANMGQYIYYTYTNDKTKDTLKFNQSDLSKYGSIEDSGYVFLKVDTILPKAIAQNLPNVNPMNMAMLSSFTLLNNDGVSITEEILKTQGPHFLLYIKDVDYSGCTKKAIDAVVEASSTYTTYIVAQNTNKLIALNLPRVGILTVNDDVQLKAMDRSMGTLVVIKDGVIAAKYGCADVAAGIKKWMPHN